jgi:ferredoxin
MIAETIQDAYDQVRAANPGAPIEVKSFANPFVLHVFKDMEAFDAGEYELVKVGQITRPNGYNPCAACGEAALDAALCVWCELGAEENNDNPDSIYDPEFDEGKLGVWADAGEAIAEGEQEVLDHPIIPPPVTGGPMIPEKCWECGVHTINPHGQVRFGNSVQDGIFCDDCHDQIEREASPEVCAWCLPEFSQPAAKLYIDKLGNRFGLCQEDAKLLEADQDVPDDLKRPI